MQEVNVSALRANLAQMRAADTRTALQRALCAVNLSTTATKAEVQKAYDIAVYDCAWNYAARLKAALNLF